MYRLHFNLKDEINGPFNLSVTLESGQTAAPQWFPFERGYWENVKLGNMYVKVQVKVTGRSDEPVLWVDVLAEEDTELTNSIEEYIRRYLLQLFTLDLNLQSFYKKFKNDIIGDSFLPIKGLRLMEAPDPFESLIYSILSQNTSIHRWNTVARNISRRLSKPIKFRDGSISHPFPDSDTLTSTDINTLLSCGIGYRAKYISNISSKVTCGELNLDKLKKCRYRDAKIRLIDFLGVGPKVADCFLLYGLGFQEAAPVDIWIQRIASQLYFNNKVVDKEVIRKFLQKRYRHYAGLVQLYLYQYARTSHS